MKKPIKDVKKTINENGDMIITVTRMDGKSEVVWTVKDAKSRGPIESEEEAKLILDDYEVVKKDEQQPSKRIYIKSSGITEYAGKVYLKLAVTKRYAYNLFHKESKGWVYKLDEKGIYTSDKKSYGRMMFTQADIDILGNAEDFDVIKVEIGQGKQYPRNKIAK